MQRKSHIVGGSFVISAAAGVVAGLAATPAAKAATSVTETVDPTAITDAYINVFKDAALTQYVTGYVSNLAALPATYSGSDLTLGANTSYTDGTGGASGPSAAGSDTINGVSYQDTQTIAGDNVTFTFTVLSDTLQSPYQFEAFVADFAPDYSSNFRTTSPVITAPGTYSVTLNNTNATDHIQYGFEINGPNTTDALAPTYGTVVVGPVTVPEPASLGVVALAAGGTLIRRRRA